MKRFVLFFVAGVFLALVQTTFLCSIFPSTPRPNLILIVMVYLATSVDAGWALLWTASLGLVFDVFSGGPFGLFVFVFLAVHVLIKGVGRVLLLKHPVFLAGTVLLAHFLQTASLAAILAVLGLPFPEELSRAEIIPLFVGLFAVALISLPSFVLLQRIDSPPALPRLDRGSMDV